LAIKREHGVGPLLESAIERRGVYHRFPLEIINEAASEQNPPPPGSLLMKRNILQSKGASALSHK